MMPLGAGRVAILLALVIFVCTAVHASAQLYEWTDEQGRKNFTDDPNRIPEKYRSKATQSPGLLATPEAIRRDAERRRQEERAATEVDARAGLEHFCAMVEIAGG